MASKCLSGGRSSAARLATNYEWLVNGSVQVGHTQDYLPSENISKGDVVEIRVTASAGEDSVTRQASVTVRNIPPNVQAMLSPELPDTGDDTALSYRVSDADGDDLSTFRFGLDYGPVGMTVDPVSGRVEWDARLPMFDREMDIGWQIGSSNSPAETTPGVLRVVDSDRQYPFMVSGTSGPREDGVRIVDLDGDGDDEMLVLNGSGHVYALEWNGQDYRQAWAHPFAITEEAGFSGLTTGDIDGDGRHEIFLAARGSHDGDDTMIRLDGSDRRVGDSATVPRMSLRAYEGTVDLEFADLDNDGSFEIVYMADADPLFHTRIIVLSADNLSVLWESAPDYLGHFVEVGNLDDDAGLEIIVSGGHVFDGITYAREWSHASAYSADNASQTSTERSVYARDVDGDGLDEIIGILDHDAFDASVEVYSVAKGRMIGNAGPLPSTIFDSRVLSPLAADIDDDGVVEILGVSFAYGSVSAYRYLESTDEFRQVFAREANSVFYAPLVSGIWTATALPSWF